MVPSGNMGVFDPTEIHNRGQLKSHMKEAMIKLGFHLLCFFMYLYRWVYSPGIFLDAICFWRVRYYYTVGFCINIAELLGIMWISCGCVDFLCHVIESGFHSVWPGVELLHVISYSLAVEAINMLKTVLAVLSLPWYPAVRSHCLL